MELILWRHGDAESGVPDELRRLTPRGVEEAARMAAWLKPRLPGGCRILVSPALRAQQTAQALGLPFETDAGLASGASVEQLLRVAGWPDARATTLIVGHEPTLGRAAGQLLSPDGAERPLVKGAIVWLAPRKDPSTGAALTAEMAPDSLVP
jgi:phosphohistidine phosphatase